MLSKLRLFFRKAPPRPALTPAGLSPGQIADLQDLSRHAGFPVWLGLIEDAAAYEAAALLSCSDADTAMSIACRVQVWQRCHDLLSNLFHAAEAINEFRSKHANGRQQPNPNYHLGSPTFWR